MGFLFNRPAPRQSVPQDLGGLRSTIIQLLTGGGGARPNPQGLLGQMPRPSFLGGQGSSNPDMHSMGILGDLLGLTSSQTPGGDVLGPLGTQFRQNLDYGLTRINASSPNRFSTANTFTQGQFTQQALNDYNLLAQQTLEQGRNRQLQAIMGILNPALGPAFGGPFTQNASPWENLLGGAQTVASFMHPGASSLGGLGGQGTG